MLAQRSLIAAMAALTLTLPPLAHAAPAAPNEASPGVALQGANAYKFKVGSILITALSDGTVPGDTQKLLRGTTPDETDALLRDGFLASPVEVSINNFVFRLNGHLYLVDTGAGQLFGPGYGGRLLENLAANGIRPEDVTDILITHIHTDHTGGLVQNGKMMFPAATIHVGQPDLTFFLNPENAAKAQVEMKYFDEAKAMMTPYMQAGKMQAFSGRTEIAQNVTAAIHPGHTPGSSFYEVKSGSQSILFVGDIIHVPSVQFPKPKITITYDVDQPLAAQVREEVFPVFVRERTLVAAPHLPYPGVGHVRMAGHGYEWVPVDYGNRDVK